MRPSLYALVQAAVEALGECTPKEVLARVGREIPAAQAANAGRARVARERRRGRRLRQEMDARGIIELGKSCLVSEKLIRLSAGGRIRRVHRGVYAPALRVFRPDQRAG